MEAFLKSFLVGILLFQSIAISATYQENVINVKAEERVKIIPNSATFHISIKAFNKKVDSAVVRIRPLIKSTEGVFKKYSLDQNTAKITKMTVRPVYVRKRDSDMELLDGLRQGRNRRPAWRTMGRRHGFGKGEGSKKSRVTFPIIAGSPKK